MYQKFLILNFFNQIAAELTDLEEKKEALKALLQQDIIKPTGLK